MVGSVMVRSRWKGLAQSGEMKTQGVLLGVGLFTGNPQHLFRVRAHWRAARRGYLFGYLDHPFGGRSRVEPAVLHAVEGGCEGFESLSVQLSLFGCHRVGYSLEGGGRLRRTAGSH